MKKRLPPKRHVVASPEARAQAGEAVGDLRRLAGLENEAGRVAEKMASARGPKCAELRKQLVALHHTLNALYQKVRHALLLLAGREWDLPEEKRP